MFKKLLLVGLMSLLLSFLVFVFVGEKPAVAQKGFYPLVEGEYVPNEVLVKFREGADLSSIQGAINLVQGEIITNTKGVISLSQWNPEDRSLRSFRLDSNLFHLKVPVNTEQAIYVLNQLPIVEYAEENGIVHTCETEPNDPFFEDQWALKNTGQGGGTEDADIDAPEAWDTFTGSSDIVVAVIDSGCILSPSDLQFNLWINEDEIPNNEIDDDDNGFVDDYHGYDFESNDGDPSFCSSHGVHVAAIIGARGNNNCAAAGINWDVSLMILKFIDCSGHGSISDAIKAIDYATENGAHLSNNSYRWTRSWPSIALCAKGRY